LLVEIFPGWNFADSVAPAVPEFEQSRQKAQPVAKMQNGEDKRKKERRGPKDDSLFDGSPNGGGEIGEQVDERDEERKKDER